MQDAVKSGIWFRTKVDDHWTNECFELLPEAEQDEIMSKKEPEWLRNMVKLLAKHCEVLERIVDENFDFREDEDE